MGSGSIKDLKSVKFMDFGFCSLLWQSTWLNYSTKQLFQDRNQASKELKLSCSTWCDTSHTLSPLFHLLSERFRRKLCKIFFFFFDCRQLLCTQVFFQSIFPKWHLELQKLKRGRINVYIFNFFFFWGRFNNTSSLIESIEIKYLWVESFWPILAYWKIVAEGM